MANRYAEDIKRIVGIDPNQGLLGDPKVKPAIRSMRGIGYIDPTSGSSTSVSGSAGTTQLPTNLPNGAVDTGENTAGVEGADPNDPLNNVTEATDGLADVEDIIDGTADEAKFSELNLDQDGMDFTGDNVLNTLTVYDETTGEQVDIYLQRGERLWTENDDLDDENSPFQWELGFNWTVFGIDQSTGAKVGGSACGATPYAAAANAGAIFGGDMNNAFQSIGAGSISGEGDFVASYDDSIMAPILVSTYGTQFGVERTSGGCTPGVDAYCPTTRPETEFPDDGEYQLKLANGKFIGSSFDPNLPLEFQQGSSKYNYKFGAGLTRTGSIEVTRNGGSMIYETSGGSATGIVRVYSSSGRLQAAFAANESLMNSFRP